MARIHTRFKYLVELWSQLTAEAQMPQLDRWLSLRFKSMPQLGSRDRRWYSQLMFACSRYAEFTALAFSGRDAVDLTDLLIPLDPHACWHRIRQVPSAQFVEIAIATLAARGMLDEVAGTDAAELLPLADAARPIVNQLDQMLATQNTLASHCLSAGVPVFYAEHLAMRATESAEFTPQAFLDALARRPPIWLRVHDPKRMPEILSALGKLQIDARPYGATALSVHSERGLPQLSPELASLFEIQDLASQAIGADIAARPGELIWDACAGGGGKSLQIATALAGTGRVYASDIRDYKLKELQRRAQRAGLKNISLLPGAAGAMQTLPPAVKQRGGFDCILVDAPCTGAGTWRRSPDARFRMSIGKLEELQKLQLSILGDAANHLRPDGRLIYATCSWLVAENETIIRRFQKAHPGWVVQRSQMLGSPSYDSDSMYVACLSRNLP